MTKASRGALPGIMKGLNMTSFFLARLKAFFALAMVGIATALIKAIEGAAGFDIPAEYETAIIAVVTGWTVNYTTNVVT